MVSLKPHISVVSPEYKGEKMVHELVERVVASVTKITDNYEIILVNDASPDNTWEAISVECAANPKVKGLNLSRNFGQHYAITAGLKYATGDWVVVMDCDLQDVPEEIPNLYKKAQEGYDIVYARRVVKHVGFWKRFSSTLFHIVLNWLSGTKTDSAIGNYGAYSRQVINEYNYIPQQSRSFGDLILTLGFKKGFVEVEQDPRKDGMSGYTLAKLLRLSSDIIISSSNRPLHFAVKVGVVISSVSFVLAVYNVFARLAGFITIDGFTTTVFSIWFLGGVVLLVLGIIGIYIGKIYDELKCHQLFIVKEKINI